MKDPYQTVDKVYWSIGEVALILGIAPSAVRWWLRHFNIDKEVHRSHFGKRANRRFTAKDLNRLFEIKRLLHEEMYTVKGAIKKFETLTQTI